MLTHQNFNIKPSKWYNLFMFAVLLVCISQIMMAALIPPGIRITIIVFLVGYTCWILWRFGFLFSKNSVLGLTKLEDGSWVLRCRGQTYDHARLENKSVVSSWIMGLVFNVAEPPHTLRCVLLPDSLEKDQFRQLALLVKKNEP